MGEGVRLPKVGCTTLGESHLDIGPQGRLNLPGLWRGGADDRLGGCGRRTLKCHVVARRDEPPPEGKAVYSSYTLLGVADMPSGTL